jgi:squalene-hopene/tetraprenyl-beta-curcumene cyclase
LIAIVCQRLHTGARVHLARMKLHAHDSDIRSVFMRTFAALLILFAGTCHAPAFSPAASPTSSPEAARIATADLDAMASKAWAYLKSQQDPASGGWRVDPSRPVFPAITALAIRGMLDDPALSTNPLADPAIAAGVKFLLSMQQPDGGIYDKVLPSYNTAIAVSTLARIPTPEASAAVKKAVAFLRTLQFGEDARVYPALDESAQVVPQDHPFYGGVGYGRHGRPDLSNTAWSIEAMHDAGVEGGDPAMKRAITFLQRVQMLEKIDDPAAPSGVRAVNSMPYAKGSRQGGFIYATSENKDTIGSGQSFAGMTDETLSDGSVASRLRAYGSMTYSGFKSYIYAGLTKSDPRVIAAHDWIRRNYTVAENPGLGTDGMYYYYVVFARAMRTWGEPTIATLTPDGKPGETRLWAADLTARLRELQQEDGSFKSVDDRWMENDPVLITAYSLIALREAAR